MCVYHEQLFTTVMYNKSCMNMLCHASSAMQVIAKALVCYFLLKMKKSYVPFVQGRTTSQGSHIYIHRVQYSRCLVR